MVQDIKTFFATIEGVLLGRYFDTISPGGQWCSQTWRGYSSVLLCHPLNSFLARNRLSLHSSGLGAAQVSGPSLELLVCLKHQCTAWRWLRVASKCKTKGKKKTHPEHHWSLCPCGEFCRGCSVNNSGSPYHHSYRLMELSGYNLCRSNFGVSVIEGLGQVIFKFGN